MKQYVGISRDHSGSMSTLANAAMKDYNLNVDSIKSAATESSIDTVVSVIKCAAGSYPAKNEFEVINSSVASLQHLRSYRTPGTSTPLFDSVGELIEQLQSVPDAAKEDVSFLVMVITDGEENASRRYTAASISRKIRELQSTDRWTFTFRVPKGYAAKLAQLGIPRENILEWELSERGFETATQVTQQAVRQYYGARARGRRSMSNFYADMSHIKASDLKKELDNITQDVQFFNVVNTEEIRSFVETKIGGPMILGTAFYQLSKPERVQGYKKIAIRNRKSGAVYEGDNARQLLGIPSNGEIKLYPSSHPDFDVFIQSTSTNRKLMPNTQVLFWPSAK